ncbi:MAG: hypothetical protein Q9219_005086 [cf. Caloplaca sp. 3 TL-2023]
MVGKRKFSEHEADPSIDLSVSSCSSHSLTRANLAALNDKTREVQAPTFSPPFESMAYQTPPVGSASKASTNLTKHEIALEVWRIHLDRNLPMPITLAKLVQEVTVPRSIETTPNSKAVAIAKSVPQEWNEATELALLAFRLMYKGHRFEEDEGELMVCEQIDEQWLDRIPKPPDAKTNYALKFAIENAGNIPKPKPDLYFGYNDDAFPEVDILNIVKSLPEELLTHYGSPYFPYQTVQWKSGQGTVRKGEEQARRDTSAAIDCMYRFFKYNDDSYEPTPAETAIFSVIVHEKYVEFRLHWRRVAQDGKVSYEGDVIAEALFSREREIFNVRTAILGVLTWARGSRLAAIKKKLGALTQPPADTPNSGPPLENPNTPASKPSPPKIPSIEQGQVQPLTQPIAQSTSSQTSDPSGKSLPPCTPKQKGTQPNAQILHSPPSSSPKHKKPRNA